MTYLIVFKTLEGDVKWSNTSTSEIKVHKRTLDILKSHTFMRVHLFPLCDVGVKRCLKRNIKYIKLWLWCRWKWLNWGTQAVFHTLLGKWQKWQFGCQTTLTPVITGGRGGNWTNRSLRHIHKMDKLKLRLLRVDLPKIRLHLKDCYKIFGKYFRN